MANGHGRNLTRLKLALTGFRTLHGHWPSRVRLKQGYIDNFRALLTEEGYQQLIDKLDLVPDCIDGMRAEDEQGASFTYGVDRDPEIAMDVNVGEWLGRLSMKPYDDDEF